jgi:putative integral membrane protein (TIGR02587 family)
LAKWLKNCKLPHLSKFYVEKSMSRVEGQSTWQTEFDNFLRGVAGAFLFGAPFLYTLEVWWQGNLVSPGHLLMLLAVTYVGLVGIIRAAGFRAGIEQTPPWLQTLTDSAEAMAIGLLTAALSLFLLRLITFEMGLAAIIGRIVIEGVPFSLGVGLANYFLLESNDEDNSSAQTKAEADTSSSSQGNLWQDTFIDIGATALGAIVISFSIAPTDEVPLIAIGLSFPRLLSLIFVSLALSYVIVFEANFRSQAARRGHQGLFQTPLSETIVSYLVSLLTAMGMLWLFQLLGTDDPLSQWVSYVLVLGLPATIGGAAGRLAV